MKPSRISAVLERLLGLHWAAFIWGAPGVGKSSIVKQAARARKVPLVDIRASLLDPTDLRGIPAAVDGRAVWYPPSFLPSKEDTPGILFFDELNAAPPLVQASLYQLVLDRRVGEYHLPDGWRIIAAGNRSTDASVTFRMPAALANRFIHIDFEIDFDDWRTWAVGAKVHPLVIGFLSLRRELLFSMARTDRGFPTPRSWEIASDTLKAMQSVEECQDILPGIVGEGAAIEFLSYCGDTISEEMIKGILKDPQNAKLPEDLGSMYALISYMANRAQEKEITSVAGVLLVHLEPEPAVLLIRDILRQVPGFVRNKGYQAFVKIHQDLIV